MSKSTIRSNSVEMEIGLIVADQNWVAETTKELLKKANAVIDMVEELIYCSGLSEQSAKEWTLYHITESR